MYVIEIICERWKKKEKERRDKMGWEDDKGREMREHSQWRRKELVKSGRKTW